MTDNQIAAERSFYAWRCKIAYSDDWQTCMTLDDSQYDDETKIHAAAEVGFFYDNLRLPGWAYVIESAEVIGDSVLFAYSDPNTLQNHVR